jgi:hypothetical protein
MAVDVQKTGAVFGLIDHVVVPDFVVKRASGHGSSLGFGISGCVWNCKKGPRISEAKANNQPRGRCECKAR